jgi:hypothetical protein
LTVGDDLFGFAAAPPPPPAVAPRQPAARAGIGGHQSASAATTTWLTPPTILEALGEFDLDPCAAPAPRPWSTARVMNALEDGDGLAMQWDGRVWMNPPYTSSEIEAWLKRMAEHNHGTALIFARTETDAFARQVWARASGLLFLTGRLHFHYADGTRAAANAGAPSVLCAYGADDMDRLAASELDGAFVPLRFARFAVVAGLDLSWSQIMREWISRQPGPISVSDAYRFFARHPKIKSNPNWRAKVRQKLPLVARRVGRDSYVAAAA